MGNIHNILLNRNRKNRLTTLNNSQLNNSQLNNSQLNNYNPSLSLGVDSINMYNYLYQVNPKAANDINSGLNSIVDGLKLLGYTNEEIENFIYLFAQGISNGTISNNSFTTTSNLTLYGPQSSNFDNSQWKNLEFYGG